jgi:hypothetical protein
VPVSAVTQPDQGFSVVTGASGVFLAFLCEFAQEFAHPAGAFIDIFFGHRIGDANMFASAESFTGNGHHMRFVEQPRGQLGCGANAAFAQER